MKQLQAFRVLFAFILFWIIITLDKLHKTEKLEVEERKYHIVNESQRVETCVTYIKCQIFMYLRYISCIIWNLDFSPSSSHRTNQTTTHIYDMIFLSSFLSSTYPHHTTIKCRNLLNCFSFPFYVSKNFIRLNPND